MADPMEADRELDALVAERVMGWERALSPERIGRALLSGDPVTFLTADGLLAVARKGGPSGPWSPSTDIAAAWEVVEKLRAEHLFVSVNGSDEAGWWAAIAPREGPSIATDYTDTAPLAICLAALDAQHHRCNGASPMNEPRGVGLSGQVQHGACGLYRRLVVHRPYPQLAQPSSTGERDRNE